MSEEKNYSLEELENSQEEQSVFNFQNIFTMVVLNWQWFLLSLFICLCGALIYLRYVTPVYQVSAKMLIKDDDNRRRGSASQMLSNMQDLGFMSNSEGIENEMEILQSRILARDAVRDLKLYVQYVRESRLGKDVLMYKSQPISVDIDSAALNAWDRGLLEGAKSIKVQLSRKGSQYKVEGQTLYGGQPQGSFSETITKLPATVKTDYGVLTLIQDDAKREMSDGDTYSATILPPMVVATGYAKALSIAPSSKKTTIAELTLNDQNTRRGLDYLRQLAVC